MPRPRRFLLVISACATVALAALTSAGRALLVATHDVPFAHAFATRVAVLAGGRVVEGGPPGEVLAQPAHPATRALLNGNGG
jgi:ABC-type dipeptide/oligopeptide/nickel transport system ATPase component